MANAQTYKNHAKYVPLYHFVILPLLVANVVVMGRRAFAAPDTDAIWTAVMAAILFFVALYARVFALRAQDRIIRLEMRLRLRELLPADQHAQIAGLTTEQLVGLRFASDAELPGLVARVLKDGIANRKPIKQMVTNWQGDYDRV